MTSVDSEHVGPGPLAGVRVIDLSSVVMVPWASQILADLGADVVTVEPPSGNVARWMSAGPADGLSGIALNLLRNKRNVSLDLKVVEDRRRLVSLLAECDVFLTNLRTGVLARAGLDLIELGERFARLICCQAIGFPPTSDRSEDPAYDDIIQAASGVSDLFARRNGTPEYVPMAMADKVCGLTVVYAVLAALFHRERTGEGQVISVPMLDSVVAFNLVENGAAAISEPPQGEPGYRRVLAPMRRPQQTSDGWISVMPYSYENFEYLFEAGGRMYGRVDERLASAASRVEHADAIYADLAEIIAEHTTDFWVDICRTGNVPYSRVASIGELITELPVASHPTAGEYHVTPQPVRWSTWPDFQVRRHAASIGEHTAEVFAEIGLETPT